MADEEPRYTNWIRTQPCAACGTTIGIEPHHALFGTTYNPEGPRPPKAIPDARKGGSQRSHDYFSIPLCMKHHTPGLHKLAGPFAGWTGSQLESWERDRVREHRNRYAMQCPEPLAAATSSRTTRPRANPNDAAHRERLRIASWLRDRAGARHLKVNEAAVLTDAASELEQQTGGEF